MQNLVHIFLLGVIAHSSVTSDNDPGGTRLPAGNGGGRYRIDT
jgi:hypothetical protein